MSESMDFKDILKNQLEALDETLKSLKSDDVLVKEMTINLPLQGAEAAYVVVKLPSFHEFFDLLEVGGNTAKFAETLIKSCLVRFVIKYPDRVISSEGMDNPVEFFLKGLHPAIPLYVFSRVLDVFSSINIGR